MTKAGPLRIKQLQYLDDLSSIDPEVCPGGRGGWWQGGGGWWHLMVPCTQVPTISASRSYLHHLFKQHEPLYA